MPHDIPKSRRRRRAPSAAPAGHRPGPEQPITAFLEPTTARTSPDDLDDAAAAAAQTNIEGEPADNNNPIDPGPM